jgi:geranylgeranyl diphosphate synthase, type II
MSVTTASITETCQSLRDRVNSRLEKYVEQAPGVPPRLREAMAYSLLAGGKRLRPILVLLSCEACGGDAESAMPAACAIEMIHTYSLIHDDLPAMDNDDLRRGRPTNHVVFGEGLAILAGDGLLTLAFEVLANDISPAATAAACCADLARAAGMAGMVGGQVADLEAESRTVSSLEELEGIHRRKTGALLASSLTLGARVAHANDEDLHRLASYGRALGLAFQITDDLLDVCGCSQNLGKAVNKDASRGKLTYPVLLGSEASRLRAECQIAEACQWIGPFGERGRRLESLAHFVLERDH